MKKGICLALCGAALLELSACSSAGAYGRELEDTVLVQVLGVDVMGTRVTLTAAGAGGEEETVLGHASGATLEEALRALPTAGDRYFSLTSVGELIVGDGVDWRELLDYVLMDPDMSWTAGVWAVNGFAGALMEETEDGGISRLALLKKNGPEPATVKSALAELLSDGRTALLVLAVKDGLAEPVGTLEICCFSPPEAGKNK